MTKYTAWQPYTYNRVTIYLTAAPGNRRYIDPASVPEDVPINNPDLPRLNRKSAETMRTYLLAHGPSPITAIIGTDDRDHVNAASRLLLARPDLFERVGRAPRTPGCWGSTPILWRAKGATA